ncbi:MAG: hypothetical protein ACRDZW_08400 [Acidimicrobiales bacterium]
MSDIARVALVEDEYSTRITVRTVAGSIRTGPADHALGAADALRLGSA